MRRAPGDLDAVRGTHNRRGPISSEPSITVGTAAALPITTAVKLEEVPLESSDYLPSTLQCQLIAQYHPKIIEAKIDRKSVV